MSMRELADEAIEVLNARMETHVNSMCATEDEVYMAAMACRIGELEEALQKVVDAAEIGVMSRSHLNHIEKLLK